MDPGTIAVDESDLSDNSDGPLAEGAKRVRNEEGGQKYHLHGDTIEERLQALIAQCENEG